MARELKPPQAMLACGTNSSATKQSPGVFSPPHIQPGKQNQGSVVGNRTLSTFKTTERKLKTKRLLPTHMRFKFIETECRMVAATGLGEGERGSGV